MTVKKYKNAEAPFKWKQFKGDIILWLVRWYGRYALSYNDLKEMALPLSRNRQWYKTFDSAKKTIAGIEAMRMIQKGQLKYIGKGDLRAQNNFINKLFNIAA